MIEQPTAEQRKLMEDGMALKAMLDHLEGTYDVSVCFFEEQYCVTDQQGKESKLFLSIERAIDEVVEIIKAR